MPKEEDSKSPQPDIQTPPDIQPTIEQRIMALEAAQTASNRKSNSNDLGATLKSGERWLILINGLALLASIGIGVVYIYQLGEMRKATIATRNSVCVASNTLAEAQRSNRIQEALNQRSLSGTIENFRLDQRAWFGVADPVIAFNETAPLKILLNGKNVGKTPALNSKTQMTWIEKGRNDAFTLADIKYEHGSAFSGDIPPGAYLPIFANLDAIVPNQHQALEAIRKGDNIMYVFANVTYSDIFRRSHWLHICMIVDKDLNHAGFCKIYNQTDADEGEPHKEPPPLASPSDAAPAPCVIEPR